MSKIEDEIAKAWRCAAADLGIQFTSPFAVTISEHSLDGIGFVHQFGRRVGTIISVLNEPSSLAHLIGKWRNEDYFISVLGSGYRSYDRKRFIDTLNDWQFFGPDSLRPVWYTGEPW